MGQQVQSRPQNLSAADRQGGRGNAETLHAAEAATDPAAQDRAVGGRVPGAALDMPSHRDTDRTGIRRDVQRQVSAGTTQVTGFSSQTPRKRALERNEETIARRVKILRRPLNAGASCTSEI